MALNANSPGYRDVNGVSQRPAGASAVMVFTAVGFKTAISKLIQPPSELPTK